MLNKNLHPCSSFKIPWLKCLDSFLRLANRNYMEKMQTLMGMCHTERFHDSEFSKESNLCLKVTSRNVECHHTKFF